MMTLTTCSVPGPLPPAALPRGVPCAHLVLWLQGLPEGPQPVSGCTLVCVPAPFLSPEALPCDGTVVP
jgi:hypothetical protein